MAQDEKYIYRCLELALLGAGEVAPNPMVGSVIVNNGKIIGEGFHQKIGSPHAEVNAINSVKDKELFKESTLYVSLEPCAHFGRTPPCSDLIVKMKIPRVVIGTVDYHSKVSGQGIKKMEDSGISVSTGVLEKECLELNKRFFTYHKEKRPYIILKWAQTIDGYIDNDRNVNVYGEPTWITNELSRRLVHKIRSEESAILVGTKTALKDNPSLTVRDWTGNNPSRIVIDRNLSLSKDLNIFNKDAQTYIVNSVKNQVSENLHYVKINFKDNTLGQIMDKLYEFEIISLIIEGGADTLKRFITSNLWDEAHIYTGQKFFKNGIKAPELKRKPLFTENLDDSILYIFRNQ